MNQLLDIKVLRNPMDFDIGFSAIIFKDWKYHLVVFGKDNSVSRHTTHVSLRSARKSFYNKFASGELVAPKWYNKKIEYTTQPDVQLFIEGKSKLAWGKLFKNLDGDRVKKEKYYGTCHRIPIDS